MIPKSFEEKEHELRLFFCVRSDLSIARSQLMELAVQGTWHTLQNARAQNSAHYHTYNAVAQPKIAKRVKGLHHLLRAQEETQKLGLPCAMIALNGTPAFFAIGPCSKAQLPKFVQGLQMLGDMDPPSLVMPAKTGLRFFLIERVEAGIPYGKLAAQAGHGLWRALREPQDTPLVQAWHQAGCPVEARQTQTLEHMHALHEEAKSLGVPTAFIIDQGRTVYQGVPTPTTLGIGPLMAPTALMQSLLLA